MAPNILLITELLPSLFICIFSEGNKVLMWHRQDLTLFTGNIESYPELLLPSDVLYNHHLDVFFNFSCPFCPRGLPWTGIESGLTPACLMTGWKITERQRPLVGSLEVHTYSEFQPWIIICSFSIFPKLQFGETLRVLWTPALTKTSLSWVTQSVSPLNTLTSMQIDTRL